MRGKLQRILPKAPTKRLREIKQRLDGKRQEFTLESWLFEPSLQRAVGRWVAPADNPYKFEEGAYSWGCWGSGVFGSLGLGAYRMHSPNGSLKMYRFDVIGSLTFECETNASTQTLIFEDLLLDATVNPDGELVFEDEDEVEEAQAENLLSTIQLRQLREARAALESDVAAITSAVDRAIEDAIALQAARCGDTPRSRI